MDRVLTWVYCCGPQRHRFPRRCLDAGDAQVEIIVVEMASTGIVSLSRYKTKITRRRTLFDLGEGGNIHLGGNSHRFLMWLYYRYAKEVVPVGCWYLMRMDDHGL